MTIKEHLQELQAIIRQIEIDGHMTDFEIVRRVNAADYEITKALTYIINEYKFSDETNRH